MTDEKLNIRIKICCDAMGDAVILNEFRKGIIQEEDGIYIWWRDGDLMPMNYCPSCGKKIEKVKNRS